MAGIDVTRSSAITPYVRFAAPFAWVHHLILVCCSHSFLLVYSIFIFKGNLTEIPCGGEVMRDIPADSFPPSSFDNCTSSKRI